MASSRYFANFGRKDFVVCSGERKQGGRSLESGVEDRGNFGVTHEFQGIADGVGQVHVAGSDTHASGSPLTKSLSPPLPLKLLCCSRGSRHVKPAGLLEMRGRAQPDRLGCALLSVTGYCFRFGLLFAPALLAADSPVRDPCCSRGPKNISEPSSSSQNNWPPLAW